MKKYELLKGYTINKFGRTLYRIIASRDFDNVLRGCLGGYIEKEENLSHDGDCWVNGDAIVYGDARIRGDAKVYGNATIYGDANIRGNAIIYDNAIVCEDALIRDSAVVYGNAKIYGNAQVYDVARVFGDARVSGNALVNANANISNDAVIEFKSDYCVISGFGHGVGTATFYKCANNIIRVNYDYFNLSVTIDEFRQRIKEIYKDNDDYVKEYLALSDLVEKRLSVYTNKGGK